MAVSILCYVIELDGEAIPQQFISNFQIWLKWPYMLEYSSDITLHPSEKRVLVLLLTITSLEYETFNAYHRIRQDSDHLPGARGGVHHPAHEGQVRLRAIFERKRPGVNLGLFIFSKQFMLNKWFFTWYTSCCYNIWFQKINGKTALTNINLYIIARLTPITETGCAPQAVMLTMIFPSFLIRMRYIPYLYKRFYLSSALSVFRYELFCLAIISSSHCS